VTGVADHLAAAAAHARAIVEHTAGRDEEIVAARRKGHALRAIAEAAGMSHPGVMKVIRRTRGGR
jgi:hypothetical protein